MPLDPRLDPRGRDRVHVQQAGYMCAINGIHSAIYRAPVKKGLHHPRECVEFKQEYFPEKEPGNF